MLDIDSRFTLRVTLLTIQCPVREIAYNQSIHREMTEDVRSMEGAASRDIHRVSR